MNPRALFLAAALLAAADAGASTYIWTGASGDRYSDAGNWTGGSPVADVEAELIFGDDGPRRVVFDVPATVRSIAFAGISYKLTGQPIAVRRISTRLFNGINEIANDIELRGALDLAVPSAGTLVLSGSIRGTGAITKSGVGTASFGGTRANTYTGVTRVASGALQLEKPAGVRAISDRIDILSSLPHAGSVMALSPHQVPREAEVYTDEWTRFFFLTEHIHKLSMEGNSKAEGRALTVDDIDIVGDNPGPNDVRFDTILYLSGHHDIDVAGGVYGIEIYRLIAEEDSSLTVRGKGRFVVNFASLIPRLTVDGPQFRIANSSPREAVLRSGTWRGSAFSLLATGGTILDGLAGTLRLGSGATFRTDVTGTTPFRVLTSAELGGAMLEVPALCDAAECPVIATDPGGKVSGTFAGLPEGALVTAVNTATGYITYRGGDGNDVVIRRAGGGQMRAEVRGHVQDLDAATIDVTFLGTAPATGTVTLKENGNVLATVTPVGLKAELTHRFAAGSHQVVIEYSGDPARAAASLPLTVPVHPRTPVIASVEPPEVTSGVGRMTFTVRGDHFLPGTTVTGHGNASIEYVSRTELRLTMEIGEASSTTIAGFTLRQPAPGAEPAGAFVRVNVPGGTPRLTFSGRSATARVIPGAKTLWVLTGAGPRFTATITDSDNDGVVRWDVPEQPGSTGPIADDWTFIVVDAANGDWIVNKPGAIQGFLSSPLPAGMIVRGPDGAYSVLDLPNQSDVVWIRPRVGVWLRLRLGSETPGDLDLFQNDRMLYDTASFLPLGDSPAVPDGIAGGDIVLAGQFPREDTLVAGEAATVLGAPSPSVLRVGGYELIDPSAQIVFERGGGVRVAVTRTGSTEDRGSVRVRTLNDSLDFTPLDTLLTFERGQSVKVLELRIADNAVWTGDRQIVVLLEQPSGGTIDPANARRAIDVYEDEPAPVLTPVGASVPEGDSGTSTATVHLEVTGTPLGRPIDLTYTIDGGAPVPVEVIPGQSRIVVPLQYSGNVDPENDRILRVTFSTRDKVTMSHTVAALTIVDDDVARVRAVDASVAESGRARIEIARVDSGTKEVAVSWTTAPGTASPFDFVASSGQVTLTRASSEYIEIPITPDADREGNEYFHVHLTVGAGAEAFGSALVTITDDDAPPVISIGDARAGELGVALVAVKLSHAVPAQLNFNVTVTPGSATAADFTHQSRPLAFLPGFTEALISIQLTNDHVVEGDETFTVTITDAAGATIGRSTATVTIVDDDALPTVSVDDVQVMEGDAGITTYAMTIRLSAAVQHEVTVAYRFEPITASRAVDYGDSSGTVDFRFAFDPLRYRASSHIIADTIPEGVETFRIRLVSATGATIADDTAIVTIIDDDGRRRAVRH